MALAQTAHQISFGAADLLHRHGTVQRQPDAIDVIGAIAEKVLHKTLKFCRG